MHYAIGKGANYGGGGQEGQPFSPRDTHKHAQPYIRIYIIITFLEIMPLIHWIMYTFAKNISFLSSVSCDWFINEKRSNFPNI